MEEFKEVVVENFGNVIDDNSVINKGKTLIIDADSIIYTAALSSQIEMVVADRSAYSDEEWDEISSNPSYNEDDGVYNVSNLNMGIETASDKINRLLTISGCDNVELAFTAGKCFRFTLGDCSYKDNRKKIIRPAGLVEIKDAISNKFKSINCVNIEADDYVCYKVRTNPLYICSAIDKDVLYSNPGKVLNYYEANYITRNGNIVSRNIHWETVSEKQSDYWPFIQCLEGDSSDNIIGPKGIGPKTMLKFFGVTLTKDEKKEVKKVSDLLKFIDKFPEFNVYNAWNSVVTAYESKGLSEMDALANANLLAMNLYTDIDSRYIDDALFVDYENDKMVISFETYMEVKYGRN